MTERLLREDFPEQPSEEQIRGILKKIKERNFYASVLVDTFFDEADPKSIVAGFKEPHGRPFYAIGARMEGYEGGFMRIGGSALLDRVTLKISFYRKEDKESDRKGLFDEDLWSGHRPRLYIESGDKSHGGMERFGSERQVLTESDLEISFATERWPLAPQAVSSDFDKWLLTDFVPRFIKDKVEPYANVPYEEMSSWVEVEEDLSEI